ncbi:unnamed protein product [Sphenostylis stenocarpa]|uniref:Uncharacterized protein n=1 Tax=Sphenostylis stenocarpa TaxID=92480 RepID=A0AA86T2F3_9FABA|nr:unnamed protein product [Sphenostylis stenocarpa]
MDPNCLIVEIRDMKHSQIYQPSRVLVFSIQNRTHIQVDSDSQEQDLLTFVLPDAACFSQSAQRKRSTKKKQRKGKYLLPHVKKQATVQEFPSYCNYGRKFSIKKGLNLEFYAITSWILGSINTTRELQYWT